MKNQIKYFLMFCGIICGLNSFAQGETCATAVPVTAGTYSSAFPMAGGGAVTTCTIPGGGGDAVNADWYVYTAPGNASVTVSSCLGGDDTRVAITEGACGAQTCITSNDDACAFAPDGSGDAYASEVTFVALAGNTYYIQWDDRWSAGAFDWSLTETLIDCPALLLNIGDPCDLAGTGDGVVSDGCACVALAAPDCPTLLVPADGAIDVAIDPSNDGVFLSWEQTGFQPVTAGYDIYWGTDPGALTNLGNTGGTAVNIINVTPGTYYWQIVPINSAGEGVGCDIFELTTTGIAADLPDCPTLLTPADGSTGVVTNGDTLNFTWANATTGDIRDANGFYLSLDPAALVFLGNLDKDSTDINITGIQQGLTYYWSVVPSNSVGEAVGCDIFSFTVAGSPDCPALGLNGLNIGNVCDDEDPLTFFDSVSAGCVCEGLVTPPNATCDGALPVEDGTYTANRIIFGGGAANNCFPDGGTDAVWYAYTPTCDGDITVRSSIDLDQPDTRLSVYTGTCAALVCEASNDDIAVDNFTSSVTFAGTGGTTYLIEFDDRWGIAEFDFEVFSGTNCPTDFAPENGVTDGDDFSTFLGNFGLSCNGTGDLCACPTDLNHDGVTNGDDFSIFLGNFGLACAAP